MSWQKRKLAITTFESTRELDPPDARAQSWENITDFLANRPPTAVQKDRLRLMKLAKFGNTPNPSGAGSYRWNGNVLHVSGIIADYDAGEVSVDEAAERLLRAGVAAFVYTSPSHKPEKPRWRVLSPLSVDVPPEQHAALVDKLNGALGGILAPESWVLTQPMYYGRVDAEGIVYETRLTLGAPLDLAAVAPIDKHGNAPGAAPERTRAEIPAPSADLDELRELFSGYDFAGYNSWLEGIQIIHHETEGSEDGFALAVQLSEPHWNAKQNSPFGSCADEIASKWDGFGNTPNPKTAGSLRREQVAADADFGAPVADQLDDVLAEAEAAQHAARLAQFKWSTLAEAIKRPSPSWIIKGVLPEKPINMIFGPSGAGKSAVTLDMSLAVVRGIPWRDARVKQGSVCWLAAEAEGSMQPRGSAYVKHHGLDTVDGFHILGTGIDLSNRETMQALAESARAFEPVLIVVDTLAAAAGSANENSGEDMNPVLDNCALIHAITGASVLLVHHSGKDESKGSRGWSGIKARVDAQIEVKKRENNDKVRDIIVDKLRDGAEGAAMPFELSIVDLGVDADGDKLSSVVVKHLSEKEAPQQKDEPVRKSRPVALELAYATLEKLRGIDGGDTIDMDRYLEHYASELPHTPGAKDTRKTKANADLTALVKRGEVSVDSVTRAITMLLKVADKVDLGPPVRDPDEDLL